MNKPCVLLSVAQESEKNYVEAFSFHGFETHAAYLPEDTGFDALVLCGGGDVDPSFYCEKNCGSESPDILRDRAEFSLFEKYYSLGKPIIGICRGCQLINVAMGGSLVQHIPSYIDHVHCNGHDNIHSVVNTPGTVLDTLFGKEMTVNSSHHQACSVMGQGIDAIQHHADGTVEAIAGNNIIAFQWHPERMTASFFDERYSDPSNIFEEIKRMIN